MSHQYILSLHGSPGIAVVDLMRQLVHLSDHAFDLGDQPVKE